MAQALSFLFHAQGAPDVLSSRAGHASVAKVPAKDHAGVRDSEKTRSGEEPSLHDSNVYFNEPWAASACWKLCIRRSVQYPPKRLLEGRRDKSTPFREGVVQTDRARVLGTGIHFHEYFGDFSLDVCVSGDRQAQTRAGTKTADLVNPISHTKLASTLDNQLPPILSLIVDGFPPLQQSKFVPEAEEILHQYVERYPNIVTWDEYCRVGLSAAGWVHPEVISLDRLVMISINYTLQFLMDDIFFDSPDEFVQEQYGITRGTGETPEKIREFFAHLDAIYSQQALPGTPAIENIVWEAGRDTLALSNPEWFRIYNECVLEHHRVCCGSHAEIVGGDNSNVQDLDLYSVMRGGNFGGRLVQMQIEFASNTYIPDALRVNPYLVNVTKATSIHLGFSNDVFSYHKESTSESRSTTLAI